MKKRVIDHVTQIVNSSSHIHNCHLSGTACCSGNPHISLSSWISLVFSFVSVSCLAVFIDHEFCRCDTGIFQRLVYEGIGVDALKNNT